MAKKYCYDEFTTDYEATIAIDYFNKVIETKDSNINVLKTFILLILIIELMNLKPLIYINYGFPFYLFFILIYF